MPSSRNQFFCTEQNSAFKLRTVLHGFCQLDPVGLVARFLPLAELLSNRSDVVMKKMWARQDIVFKKALKYELEWEINDYQWAKNEGYEEDHTHEKHFCAMQTEATTH